MRGFQTEGKKTGTCVQGKTWHQRPNNYSQKSRTAQGFRVNLRHILGLAEHRREAAGKRLPADLGPDKLKQSNSSADGDSASSAVKREACEHLAWVPLKLDRNVLWVLKRRPVSRRSRDVRGNEPFRCFSPSFVPFYLAFLPRSAEENLSVLEVIQSLLLDGCIPSPSPASPPVHLLTQTADCNR